MNSINQSSPNGLFIFSLDTELACGYFDKDEKRTKIFSTNGVRERQAVKRLLDLFEKYHITATWAITGHLFYQSCEECPICPMMEWKGRYSSFEEVYQTNNPLWYGSDLIEMILNKNIPSEIGFHGYSHRPFNQINREEAKLEIEEWLRVSQRFHITPVSIVFPRDAVGHLEIFQHYGFKTYRTEEHVPLIFRNRYFGKYIKTLDVLFSITTPPIYEINQLKIKEGLVNIPASQHLFGFNRGLENYLDHKGYSTLRIQRILKGIRKAARQKKIFHLWAHEWEFRTEADFIRLEAILQCVEECQHQYGLESISMAECSTYVRTTLK